MNDKKSKISLSALERQLWEAAHNITGPIDTSDYTTYIFPILFLKRVYDEEFKEAILLLKIKHRMRFTTVYLVRLPKLPDDFLSFYFL